MEKIIRSSEMPSGNLNYAQTQFMREHNLSPTFDKKSKKWQLIKVPKSSTKNVAWHVRIGEEDFLFVHISGSGHSISIFATDKKGKEVNYSKPIKTYNTYVDLESAVDKFYNEEYEQKIANESADGVSQTIEG